MSILAMTMDTTESNAETQVSETWSDAEDRQWRQLHAKRMRVYRAAHKSAGLCAWCNTPAANSLCEAHAVSNRTRRQQRESVIVPPYEPGPVP